MRDFKKLQDDPPPGICGAPTEDNIMNWHCVIFGPKDTPYEDGTFRVTMLFTEEYPTKAPTVKFVSKMFHPNVYADGAICLDILQNRWSPTYDVAAILTSIQSLLDEPNPNSPANSLAAQLYQENRREYEKRVAAIVEQSWISFTDGQDDADKEKKKWAFNRILLLCKSACVFLILFALKLPFFSNMPKYFNPDSGVLHFNSPV